MNHLWKIYILEYEVKLPLSSTRPVWMFSFGQGWKWLYPVKPFTCFTTPLSLSFSHKGRPLTSFFCRATVASTRRKEQWPLRHLGGKGVEVLFHDPDLWLWTSLFKFFTYILLFSRKQYFTVSFFLTFVDHILFNTFLYFIISSIL